jgi:hypothetical protein
MKPATTHVDRETVFQWIMDKEWRRLLQFVHANPKAGNNDVIVQTAVETGIRQLISEMDSAPNETLYANIMQLYSMHRTGVYPLTKDLFSGLVAQIVVRNKDNIELAYSFAVQAPERDVCLDVIRRYKEAQPTQIAHTRTTTIQVTVNREVADTDFTISLFKSRQEFDFFQAVRQVFPRYDVYPNVAISCVIDFDKIEPVITPDERRYFFMGIIDCVVFDHLQGYKPLYFFELDSAFHDAPEQKARDEFKDRILAVAGQRLYRVRKVSAQVTQDDFVEMIRQVLDAR